MNKADTAFLVGGLIYGIVLGFGGAFAVVHRPDLDALGTHDDSRAAAPSGPPAPTMPSQGGNAADGAPAMARIRDLKARLDEAPDDVDALLEMADLYHRVSMFDQASLSPAAPPFVDEVEGTGRESGRSPAEETVVEVDRPLDAGGRPADADAIAAVSHGLLAHALSAVDRPNDEGATGVGGSPTDALPQARSNGLPHLLGDQLDSGVQSLTAQFAAVAGRFDSAVDRLAQSLLAGAR